MHQARNNDWLHFSGLFAAMYAGFGVASPYLPGYLSSLGLTPTELGTLLGGGTAIRLLAGPLAGRIADRIGSLAKVLNTCLGLAVAVTLCYLGARHYFALLLISLAYAAVLAPVTQLADAMTIAAASRGQVQFEYGWVRGTGSAAFILGTLLAGQVIAATGPASALWLQVLLLSVSLLMAARVPQYPAPTSVPALRSSRAEVLRLLQIPRYRRLVIVASLVLGSHAMHDAFAMIRWQAAGISPTTASLLWSEAVAGEVLVFLLLGPTLLRYLSPAGAMLLAAVAGTLRWTIMAQTATVAALALIQPLHGLSFALLHMACMRLLAQLVPIGMEGTAQAIYATVGIGSISALLTFGSGSLYALWGAQGFLVMAMLCVLAIPLTYGLRARP